MATREGSAPLQHLRQRHHPRSLPRLRTPGGPHGAGHARGRAAPSAGAADAGATSRHRCGSTTPTSTSATTSATSPCRSRARCASCSTSPASSRATRSNAPGPLWQFVVVDGLRGGQVGADREAAPHHRRRRDAACRCRCSSSTSHATRPSRRRSTRPRSSGPTSRPRPRPTRISCATWSRAACACRSASSARSSDLLADPTGIPDAGNAAADTIRGVMSQLNDTEQAHSPLWTAAVAAASASRCCARRSTRRRTAAKKLGGTLNTAFLTAAAEAAGSYHRELGSPVEELRASMAISTRTDDSGSNAFSLARMMVPTGEMPIADRFRAIQAATGAAREASGRRIARGTGGGGGIAAHVARHPARPAAGPDGRLRHLERARRTDADVRGGRAAAGELPGRAAWVAWRSTSRCSATTTASTWGSTSTVRP